MAMEFCKKHPGQKAVGRCETCHAPVCEKCAVSAEGTDRIFCCQEHAQRFMAYEQGKGTKKIRRFKERSIFFILIKWAIIIAVVLAVVSAAGHFGLGMDPTGLWARFGF